jgi:hypothetical protein
MRAPPNLPVQGRPHVGQECSPVTLAGGQINSMRVGLKAGGSRAGPCPSQLCVFHLERESKRGQFRRHIIVSGLSYDRMHTVLTEGLLFKCGDQTNRAGPVGHGASAAILVNDRPLNIGQPSNPSRVMISTCRLIDAYRSRPARALENLANVHFSVSFARPL